MATEHGGKLSDTETEDLVDQLAEQPDEGQAVMRLVAAREYKAGLSPAQIEDKYGWSEGTVYHWLGYFEKRGDDAALVDKPRSGRPRKLTDEQYEQFIDELQESPQEFGYDHQAWFPLLAHHYLRSEYDVEYSLRHIRRLLNEAELSWRTARPRHHKADSEEEVEFQETVEKNETTSTNRI
jgi:transposase